MKDALFHLAFPTHDRAAAKRFYVERLGCTSGQSSMPTITNIRTDGLPFSPIYLRHLGAL
jgi:extradiol dioxygenase family protein